VAGGDLGARHRQRGAGATGLGGRVDWGRAPPLAGPRPLSAALRARRRQRSATTCANRNTWRHTYASAYIRARVAPPCLPKHQALTSARDGNRPVPWAMLPQSPCTSVGGRTHMRANDRAKAPAAERHRRGNSLYWSFGRGSWPSPRRRDAETGLCNNPHSHPPIGVILHVATDDNARAAELCERRSVTVRWPYPAQTDVRFGATEEALSSWKKP
jgi:hypothetical protein